MHLAKTLRSSTLKLALICIGVFGTAVLALFIYVYCSTASYVRSRSDHAIATERVILQQAYDRAGRGGLIAAIEQRIADERFEGGLYLLADLSFAPVAGNLKIWPSALKGPKGWGNFSTQDWKPDSDRALLRAEFETLPDGYHLLVGKNIDDLGEFAGKIKTALAWSTSFTFILAGVASVMVTRRTVGRIEAINATSRAIMHSGLDKRIPLRGTRDEWDQLADNLNLMLDRIEGLVGEVKQVTDNVAHDLRTPLARMRGRLEKAYNRRRDRDDDQSLIGDTIADLDAVLRMFASLTRISQIEANDRMAGFRPVNLADIARDVVELFDAAAEEKGGHLSVVADQQVLVTGDRDLLFDAVANLVDNAIKHGRETGQVTVEVTESDGGTVLSVADDGPGIPVDECQHVFKRFYRLESSRRTPGNGLGLSLVAAVARLHGARIEMVDNAPGLKIRLRLPWPPGPASKSEVYQGTDF
ncbi:Signal transduction histidine kinase [Rhizobiales bacterium GAS191]|nr:Signal transduction histidine kinase [Rhizobiales bacterium GAS191]